MGKNDKLVIDSSIGNILSTSQAMTVDNILAALQFKQLPNTYIFKQEFHSDKFWNFLRNDLKIKDENILVATEYNIDSDNLEHIYYKYSVNFSDGNCNIIFVFNDEIRNIKEEDYYEYVSDAEKSNKITNLSAYFDFSTKKFIESYLIKIKESMYISVIENQFYTVGIVGGEYSLIPKKIRKTDDDIELNYGKKFVESDKKIMDLIENKSGLYFFHGSPGCGKTSYIRILIKRLCNKKDFLFIPSYMVEHLAEPSMITFLSQYDNTILILEDSENILQSQDGYRNAGVSNLLNLTDGFLNDFLKMSVICTYNIEKNNIDKALKRAGRLVAEIEFGKLNAKEATILSKHIGKNEKFTTSMSLADIYNKADQFIDDSLEADDDKPKIGFRK